MGAELVRSVRVTFLRLDSRVADEDEVVRAV